MRSSIRPLFVLCALFFPTISAAQVVINEIMYVPTPPEPEWVELYNAADTAVRMTGWTVQDRSSAKPTIPAAVIPAKGYLILARDSAAFKSLRSPGSAVVQLTLPALNNTGDDVILRNAAGKTIDSVSWSSSWGGAGGPSLERITATHPSNERTSWKSAVDSTGATPGFRNSVAPAARDLTLRTLSFDPDKKEVRITVENSGTERSVGATLSLYYDANNDTLGTPEETQSGRSIPQIEPGDSLSFAMKWNRPLTVPGEPGLIVVDHPEDEHPEDNRGILLVREKFVDTGIVINEFIYAPAAPEPEWVELYNRGSYPVELTGWVLHDAGTARPKIGGAILLPGDYLVLTRDTAELREAREIPSSLLQFSLPSLNNGSDNIVLRNRSGLAVDSLGYRSSWGGLNGRSVERREPGLSTNDSASWGSSVDPARGTAGRKNSLVPPKVNLGIGSVTFDADAGELHATVINTGMEATSGGRLFLHYDANEDSIPQEDEEIIHHDLPVIEPGDSIEGKLPWNRPLRLEGEKAIFLLRLEGDERPGDDTARFTPRLPTVDTGVIVNEFMFDPNDPEPEWLELYNRGSRPVNLGGWRIADGSGSSGPLPSLFLLPAQYLVVTSDTAALLALRSVPSQRVRLLLPAFNNSGDGVVLRNSSGATIDSLRYASGWGGKDGVSLERKGFDLPSSDPGSWTSAINPEGGTPGEKNSWEPIVRDLAVGPISFDPDAPAVTATLYNHAVEPSGDAEAVLYVDENRNALPDPGEEMGRTTISSIPPGDSLTLSLEWSRPLTAAGEEGVLEIVLANDQRPNDNLGTFRAILPPVDSGVVVNEIMFDPNSPEPEWVELYNRGTLPVQLKGWEIRDGSTSRAELPDFLLLPGEYAVITSDSGELHRLREIPSGIIQILHPSFNNSGDRVLLRNPSGKEIDDFTYTSSWGGKDGISLERKDPEAPAKDGTSWKSSVDSTGATPGRTNSASLPEKNIALKSLFFDPATATLSALILNTGDAPTTGAEAILYYDANGDGSGEAGEELSRTGIVSILPSDSATLSLPWPRPLRTEKERGILLLAMPGDRNGRDDTGTFTARARLGESGVVVNEFMYAPPSPQPEWIELFNSGTLPVDLAGWSVADAAGPRILPEAVIEPGAYLVLTSDTVALRSAVEVPAPLLQLSLPSLNNTEDAILLRNNAGQPVDSLYYFASWGGSGGHSLERRRATDRSADSASWRSSIDSTGSTPGRANSVLPPPRNLALDSVGFDRSSGSIIGWIRNGGNEEIIGAEAILYYDRNENALGEEEEVIGRLNLPSLLPDSTLTITAAWPRLLTDEGETGLLGTNAEGDAREEDNRKGLLLRREPLDSGLVITEIMFDPIPFGELAGAEYIEVWNREGRPVPLAGWRVADGSGKEKILPEEAPFVQPNGYALIAADSALYLRFPFLADSTNIVLLGTDLGLNNTEDDVALRNPAGKTIDSIRYSDAWHWDELDDTKGISLERLTTEGGGNDPQIWSSSVAGPGGTPAAPNSRSVSTGPHNADLAADPPRISPDGDGFEDFTRISYNLGTPGGRVVVTIYDRHGRRVARPLNNSLSAAEGGFIWDGADDDGEALPAGIYILRVEAYPADGSGTKTAQAVITVARRL